jgi:hypothetical protein
MTDPALREGDNKVGAHGSEFTFAVGRKSRALGHSADRVEATH